MIEEKTHSCNVCSRNTTYIQGERGPIQVPLTVKMVGNFRFCAECLENSVEDDRTANNMILHRRRILSGPFKDHYWVTSAEEIKNGE